MPQGNGHPFPPNVPSDPSPGGGAEEQSPPQDFREYLKRFTKMAGVREDSGERMARNARYAKRLVKLARKGMLYEGKFIIAAGQSTKRKINRIVEKMGGEVTAGQVIDAALTHLEWKVDREAEGLVVFAGEPPSEDDVPEWLEPEE